MEVKSLVYHFFVSAFYEVLDDISLQVIKGEESIYWEKTDTQWTMDICIDIKIRYSFILEKKKNRSHQLIEVLHSSF